MKKISPNSALTIKRGIHSWLGSILLVCLLMPQAFATLDLDRQYSLDTIGYLKSWDNMDGLFTEYVAAAYREYFARPTRFVVNNLSEADVIFARSKLPYQKVIRDTDILAQLARSTHTETLIRTTVTKEGSQYFFTLDWLHAPHMDLISTVRFTLEDPSKGTPMGTDIVSGPLQENLDKLFSQLPFSGAVSGRDGRAVTVTLGGHEKVSPGDILVVSTLDEVKKHPLLKSIVNWKLTRTGTLSVEQVEDGMAFCKVLEEEPGRQISRFQKITQVQSPAPISTPANSVSKSDNSEEPQADDQPPRLGWVSIAVPLGSYSRLLNSPSNSAAFSGGGFNIGGQAEGQIWFTRKWFGEVNLGYSFWNYGQQATSSTSTASTSSASGSQSNLIFKFAFGYTHLLNGDIFGPKAWIKLGYKSSSFNAPVSTTDLTGPISFGTFFVGLGGDLPIRGRVGLKANFNYRIATSAGQSIFTTESLSGASDIELWIGAYYHLSPRITVSAGFEVNSYDTNFNSGSTISQKTMTFAPQLLYYF